MASPEPGSGRGAERSTDTRPMVGDTGERAGDGTPAMGRAARWNEESVEEGRAEQSINPLALPYVMMSELRYLPTYAGIYFAIEEGGEVAYIGQSEWYERQRRLM